jgi:hypothetical protein
MKFLRQVVLMVLPGLQVSLYFTNVVVLRLVAAG